MAVAAYRPLPRVSVPDPRPGDIVDMDNVGSNGRLGAQAAIDATGDKIKATLTAQLNAPETSAGTASTASSVGSRLWKLLSFSQLQDMARVKEKMLGALPRAMTSV
ncbi:hypothetical protein [Asaia sp. As-1742]|uniref:hypothetical protein n=1 Tax=Asaia sp. As-1742 TaxID=2608325 RepID=UPI00141E6D5B|nr:hypothetical protein [Asaia sp. As-1742]NIE79497.1 hypothetical protein [Asaia sp. As-1742]